APRREHALPLDLRRQRGGRARALPLPRLLPRVRRLRDTLASRVRAALGGPEPRGVRRDRRRSRRVLPPLPARADRHARPAVLPLPARRDPRLALPPLLVPHAVLDGRVVDRPRAAGCAGRGRVVGARGRLRGGDDPDQADAAGAPARGEVQPAMSGRKGTVAAWALYELGATGFAMVVLSFHLPL